MLVGFSDLLAERDRSGAALGAFTCYDLETASAVLAAGAQRDVAVTLLVSRDAFAGPEGDPLMAAIRATAEQSPCRACVQLDHVSDLELIGRAFDLGAGAVMADGSRLPFDENLALVEGATRLADAAGGAVEAELGHVAGGEDVAEATRVGGLTDPEEASRFAGASRIALLAVSIGNVHGAYAEEPRLDWERLAAIERAIEVPLSLHGASGLGGDAVRRAVAAGIRKVNFNTELREAYLRATREGLATALDGSRLLGLHRDQVAAVRAVAGDKLDLLGGSA